MPQPQANNQTDPLDFSDRYNTPIPTGRQPAFDQWVAQQTRANGKSPLRDRYNYDVNGQYLAGSGTDARGHGSDQWKKPNHPTFSDQSQYNSLDGYVGGRWVDNDKGYEPSVTNLQFRSQPELQKYFNEVEPETKLLGPQPVPVPTGAGGNYRISDFSDSPPAYRTKPPALPAPMPQLQPGAPGRRYYGQ